MNDVDALKLLKGENCQITDHIAIKQPTLGEICDFGEKRYYQTLSAFIPSPFDMIAQLDSIGIDFTKITEYELFCAIVPSIPQEDSRILFGDIDFTKFRLIRKDEKAELRYKNAVISEPVFNIMASYLRQMNCLEPPKFKQVGNEFTKQKMIEFAYNDLKYASRKKYKSSLASIVSSLVNHPNFKYGIKEVWDIKIYPFFDALKRVQIIDNTKNLYTGLYSGAISMNSINKKDLNWMRNAN